MVKKYGPPPFGTLLSANANPSTLENWGEDSWVTLHQIGNMREHNNYWYLTEIFNQKNPKPALNGEPYYAGYKDARGPGSVNYTLRSSRWHRPRQSSWYVQVCMGVFSQEDWPDMFMALKESGVQILSRPHLFICGMPSNGAPGQK